MLLRNVDLLHSIGVSLDIIAIEMLLDRHEVCIYIFQVVIHAVHVVVSVKPKARIHVFLVVD